MHTPIHSTKLTRATLLCPGLVLLSNEDIPRASDEAGLSYAGSGFVIDDSMLSSILFPCSARWMPRQLC